MVEEGVHTLCRIVKFHVTNSMIQTVMTINCVGNKDMRKVFGLEKDVLKRTGEKCITKSFIIPIICITRTDEMRNTYTCTLSPEKFQRKDNSGGYM
jgi:hypothetical protein